MKDRTHDKAMERLFRDFPIYSVDLLNDDLEKKGQGEFLVALRQLSKSFGGVHAVAAKAKMNPSQLFRILSAKGNPEMRSLSAILRAMGMRLGVDWVARPEPPPWVTFTDAGYDSDLRQILPHPGVTLRDEYLLPRGMTRGALAKGIRVSESRITNIILGRHSISPDTALRLSRFFKSSAEYWLELQLRYDLSKARFKLGRMIDRDVEACGGK